MIPAGSYGCSGTRDVLERGFSSRNQGLTSFPKHESFSFEEKNHWKQPTWNRLPAGKAGGVISASSAAWLQSELKIGCVAVCWAGAALPLPRAFLQQNELQGWAAVLAWLQREGQKSCHGGNEERDGGFPFFPVKCRVKEETAHVCVSECVLCVPRARPSSSRLQPAPLKASPDTLTGTFP